MNLFLKVIPHQTHDRTTYERWCFPRRAWHAPLSPPTPWIRCWSRCWKKHFRRLGGLLTQTAEYRQWGVSPHTIFFPPWEPHLPCRNDATCGGWSGVAHAISLLRHAPAHCVRLNSQKHWKRRKIICASTLSIPLFISTIFLIFVLLFT